MRLYAENAAIVLHSEEDVPAVPVREGADRFVDILCNVRGGFLKFNGEALTGFYHFKKFYRQLQGNRPPYAKL